MGNAANNPSIRAFVISTNCLETMAENLFVNFKRIKKIDLRTFARFRADSSGDEHLKTEKNIVPFTSLQSYFWHK